jgi:hypothetical protein
MEKNMSSGYLKIEGSVPLAGPVVEEMGDLLLFRTRTEMTETDFAELHEGQIEIGGLIEQVVLESTETSKDGRYSMDLMLRRLSPEA